MRNAIVKTIRLLATASELFSMYLDSDSLLILCFAEERPSGRIDLVHVDVPDHDHGGVTRGREEKYFEPWRDFLEIR